MNRQVVAHLDWSPTFSKKKGWVVSRCLEPSFHRVDMQANRCLGVVEAEDVDE